jgi:hypothetical protein
MLPTRELPVRELPRCVLLLVRARRLRTRRRWSLRELSRTLLPAGLPPCALLLPCALLSSHRHSGDTPF